MNKDIQIKINKQLIIIPNMSINEQLLLKGLFVNSD